MFVGTNSRAKGFGWNPGLSFLVMLGDDVRDSGREVSLDAGSREDCDTA